MTREKAALLLAKFENTHGDPEQERLNIVQYQSFGGPLAGNDVKDALSAEYRQELLDAIARGGDE